MNKSPITSEYAADQEKLEDLNLGTPLLPGDPKGRAHSRLWSDHVCAVLEHLHCTRALI